MYFSIGHIKLTFLIIICLKLEMEEIHSSSTEDTAHSYHNSCNNDKNYQQEFDDQLIPHNPWKRHIQFDQMTPLSDNSDVINGYNNNSVSDED